MNIHSIYRPFQRFFRSKRMQYFSACFNISEKTKVIDVGGTEFNWTLLDKCPIVTMVNTDVEQPASSNPKLTMMILDGKSLPFPDMSFDICYSNSVIEHVGDADSVNAFVREIKRIAPQYFVQTPNKWFPVEPHFICIFIQWLPLPIQRHLMRWLSVWGLVTKPNQPEVDRMLADIRLLTYRDMVKLFPEAEIKRERFLGITKSFIAVKTNLSNSSSA